MNLPKTPITEGEGDEKIIVRPSKAIVDTWKEIHGCEKIITIYLEKVYKLKNGEPTDELDIKKSKMVFLRPPERPDLGRGLTHGKQDTLETAIVVMQGCLLGGDMDLLKRGHKPDYLSGAALKFQTLLEFKEAELGEL